MRTAILTPIIVLSLGAASSASAATLAAGPGKTYATPCRAFAAAKAGDVIEITGNTTYSGDVCTIYPSNLTIRGVNGRARIDAAGQNAQGKGIWVVAGSNIVVENVEMFGARVPDQNGAALRLEGTNFTLRSSYLHDNENGILTGANLNSNILIENSEFAHNGYGTGYTHNLYIGNVASLTFRYNYSHDANGGHNLKSRARVNTIAYNRFSSLPEGQAGSGKPSYEINLPNAGTTYIIGNVIQQPAAHNNPNLVAYGEEGASNPGHDLYVVNNTFLNDDSSRGNFVLVGSGVTKPILLQNNIFGGSGTLSNQVGAVEKNNYRALAPGFVNRAAWDLRPTANVLVIDAASAPGVSASGLALAPAAQYRHVAGAEARPVAGQLDIGAYEAAAAPAPTSWVTCATEWGTCSFSGSREVRYGTATAFVTKTVAGPVRCANAVFGDPAPGAAKSCSYAVTATTSAAPADVSWTACASQYGICTVPGTREVRYGAAGSYATMLVTSSVKCSDAVFGDPKPGVAKSCSYSSVAR